MSFSPLRETKDGVELFVRLTPKASHNRIQGLYFDNKEQCYLKVTVTSPPVDGEANKAIIHFLAKKLGVAPSSLDLIRGHTDRHKTILIRSLSLESIQKIILP